LSFAILSSKKKSSLTLFCFGFQIGTTKQRKTKTINEKQNIKEKKEVLCSKTNC
jgi:hypothetical protein